MPNNKHVTYGRIVCDITPDKQEKHRTRLTVGGDRIFYNYDISTPTVELITVKLLLNSVVSTPNAKFMTIDITNFYLNIEMTNYEYIRMHISIFPQHIIDHYNLNNIATKDGFVYMEIRKGMYGLPQAGKLAHEKL